ncbi:MULTISPECIES: TetR/AcrR family transcriptional regulator [unclassified Streptomyces]|uniref:TetR/AcrR family transcriptional regulator n=1 Tax=unclassified Streptomyces TaxID=2593676 RepID=UPI0006AFBF35|nr:MULTISPECIES: TetR/AcrR family transcriptional regulator [unclassified Streptomyces]KOX18475.1 TetR family transcriptional regulator [Streptomyces sp. NRRL F-6491]KOX48232.1 TetR family transcriptional regulator [Streptomyces sp. NRRL F-6492]
MPDEPVPPGRRTDALRNRERILAAAAEVVGAEGTQASLRDVARRAGIGLGTLYRHFPTRDDLLETLLRTGFERLAARADELLADDLPSERALALWLGEFTLRSGSFRGLPASLMATLGDEESALHASCVAMRAAAGRLLRAAQDDGRIRPDVDGTDLFALVNAVSWAAGQAPSLAARREHLLGLVLDGLTRRDAP